MRNILIITIALLIAPLINAQVLYNETFNNFTLGNLGTDYTGTVPGQGGWYTESFNSNSPAAITQEPNKGKVLTLSALNTAVRVKKTDLNTFIDQRTAGNNVIKVEIDYYTGEQQTQGISAGFQSIILSYDPAIFGNNRLLDYTFLSINGRIDVVYNNGTYLKPVPLNNVTGSMATLPFNTWVTFIVYLDYNNKKVYFETPYFNTVAVGDFLADSTSVNLIEDFKPLVLLFNFGISDQNNSTLLANKYDNIKITALKSVPPEVLSTANFLADKFNLYPNPATNVVTITNNENRMVNKIEVYDTTGKLINTQNYNNEAELQLNVENLTSGTYMLHLQTNEGTAVKKLVKK